MANKTKPESASVEVFLEAVEDSQRRSDARQLAQIMHEITGEPAVMWGSSIVGFGAYHYKYETGREGDTMAVGFSPRKSALVVYGVLYYDQNLESAKKLGNIKLGKGCMYIKKLEDIDLALLKKMIKDAYDNRGRNE